MRRFARVLAVSTVASCAWAASAVEFLYAPSYETGLAPYEAALADLDGDSDLDVVTVDLQDQEAGTVSVALNDGSGRFAAPVSYPVGAGAAWLAVGDLNHDSRPDVAVSNTQTSGTNAVSVYLNGGDGTLGSLHFLTAPAAASPQGIAIADWNGDGHPDVAVSLLLGGGIKVFWGNGTGNFPSSALVATALDPGDLAPARFDNDAHLDLVVTGIDGAQVLYGTGSGFVGGPYLDNFFFGSDRVAAGDFDADGHPDFVTTGRALTLFLNDGTGHEWIRRFSAVGENPVGVAAGELDGDGHLDVAAAVYLGNAVSVYHGDGAGHFPVRRDWGVGLAPNDVALGDVDGDARLDLVAPSSQLDRSEFQVVLNEGDMRFRARRDIDVVGDAAGFAAADFDHDGIRDLIVAVAQSNADNLKLIFGNADGTLGDPVLVESFGNSMPTNVIAADFDGDGWTDAAASVFSPGNSMRVWINDGAGTLLPSVEYEAGGNPGSLAAGDLDGDGDLDVIVVNSALTANSISIFVGLGDGTFLPQLELPTLVAPSDVAIADFDLDGDRDALVTHVVSPAVLLFDNDGDGNLTPATISLGVGQATPTVADFDGDGWPDVALTTGLASVLFNDQAGGFTLEEGTTIASGGVGVADFDRDGDADLVATESFLSRASVLLNDGSGVFAVGAVVPVGYQSGRCSGADFTRDSKPEIVTANARAGSISFVTNTTAIGIFADGFEAGDTSAWSFSLPRSRVDERWIR